jgi:hypothetical protein
MVKGGIGDEGGCLWEKKGRATPLCCVFLSFLLFFWYNGCEEIFLISKKRRKKNGRSHVANFFF